MNLPSRDSAVYKEVLLHPLLQLNLSDHLTRTRYQRELRQARTRPHITAANTNNDDDNDDARPSSLPVVGLLIGKRRAEQSTVEITNSFELLLHESLILTSDSGSQTALALRECDSPSVNPLYWSKETLIQRIIEATEGNNNNNNNSNGGGNKNCDAETMRMYLRGEFTKEQLLWRYLLCAKHGIHDDKGFVMEDDVRNKCTELLLTFPDEEVIGFYFCVTSSSYDPHHHNDNDKNNEINIKDLFAFATDFIHLRFFPMLEPYFHQTGTHLGRNPFYILVGNAHPREEGLCNLFEFQYRKTGEEEKEKGIHPSPSFQSVLETQTSHCQEQLRLSGEVHHIPFSANLNNNNGNHNKDPPHFISLQHIRYSLDSEEIEYIGIDAALFIDLQKLNHTALPPRRGGKGREEEKTKHSRAARRGMGDHSAGDITHRRNQRLLYNKRIQQGMSAQILSENILLLLRFLEQVKNTDAAEWTIHDHRLLRDAHTIIAQLPCEAPNATTTTSSSSVSIAEAERQRTLLTRSADLLASIQGQLETLVDHEKWVVQSMKRHNSKERRGMP